MSCLDDLRDWGRENGYVLRLGAFYIVIFLAAGCYTTLLPVWLEWRKLTPEQISFLFAVPAILRPVVTPVITLTADYYARPAAFLKLLSVAALTSCLVLPFVSGFAALFPAFLVYTLCWISIIPLTEALALLGARVGQCDYGRVRLWGSAAFIAMAVGGGAAVEMWGQRAVIWLLIAALSGVAVVGLILNEPNGRSPDEKAAPLPARTLRFADVVQLVRAPEFWLLMAAASAIQAAHAVYYVFGTIHWKSIGISSSVIGALWGVGVVAEIALFIYAGRLGQRFGAVSFMLVGGAAAMFRWTCTAFDPPLAGLFALQCLHGLTYGATHYGAMQFLRRSVPDRLAVTAQGVYAATTGGIAMGLMQLAAGPVYSRFHGYAYLMMVGLAAIGIGATLLLARRWDGGALPIGQTIE